VTELLDELPYSEITVEAIAARACVSKQTIYRWWTGKHQLAMQAYTQLMQGQVQLADTGSIAGDLRALLRRSCALLNERTRGTTLAGLIVAAQNDPDFAVEFRDSYIGVRRKVIEAMLRRGVARGELVKTLDVSLAIELLYGPIWYRLLLRNAPLDDKFADAVAAAFLGAHAVARPTR